MAESAGKGHAATAPVTAPRAPMAAAPEAATAELAPIGNHHLLPLLHGARLHTDGAAAAIANRHGARAVTMGSDVYFAAGAYAPHTRAGQRLLAHELTHVMQNQRGGGAARVSTRDDHAEVEARANERAIETGGELTANAPPVAVALDGELLRAGDRLRLLLTMQDSGSVLGGPDGFVVDVQPNGQIFFEPFNARIPVASLDLQQAQGLIAAELSRVARVQLALEIRPLRLGGRDVSQGPTREQAAHDRREQRLQQFRAYIAYVHQHAPNASAETRFNQWVLDHADSEELYTRAPGTVYGEALAPRPAPESPQYARVQEYLRFIQGRRDGLATLHEPEATREREAIAQMTTWLAANQSSPRLLRVDPATLFARFVVGATLADIDRQVHRDLEARREEQLYGDAAMLARVRHRERFLALARQLWGESSTIYPYTIPINAEGRDILVTGHATRQRVLDDLAGALMQWASQHTLDPDFVHVDPRDVLLRLLEREGYSERLHQAELAPVEHESIDRHEIVWSVVIRTFGETVAKGLLTVVVIAGAAIVLGLSAPVLAGLLALAAAVAGVVAYVRRRDEIEQTNFQVPRINTAVHAVGDIFGVSALIEGLTGERLGTREQLTSVQRSTQVGEGGGQIVTQLLGPRVLRAGQGLAGELAPRVTEPPPPPINEPPPTQATPAPRDADVIPITRGRPAPAAPADVPPAPARPAPAPRDTDVIPITRGRPAQPPPPPANAPPANVPPAPPPRAPAPPPARTPPAPARGADVIPIDRARPPQPAPPAANVPPAPRAAMGGGRSAPVPQPIEPPPQPQPASPDPVAPPDPVADPAVADPPVAGRRNVPSGQQGQLPVSPPVPVPRTGRPQGPQQPQAPLWWNTNGNFATASREGGVNGVLDFRFSGRLGDYSASVTIGGTTYTEADGVGRGFYDGHHSWPMYLGGVVVQPRLGIRSVLHLNIIHAALDEYLRGLGHDIQRQASYPGNQQFIARLRRSRTFRVLVANQLRFFYSMVNLVTSPQMPVDAYERGITAGLNNLGGP